MLRGRFKLTLIANYKKSEFCLIFVTIACYNLQQNQASEGNRCKNMVGQVTQL